jgi:hypothetical protein
LPLRAVEPDRPKSRIDRRDFPLGWLAKSIGARRPSVRDAAIAFKGEVARCFSRLPNSLWDAIAWRRDPAERDVARAVIPARDVGAAGYAGGRCLKLSQGLSTRDQRPARAPYATGVDEPFMTSLASGPRVLPTQPSRRK